MTTIASEIGPRRTLNLLELRTIDMKLKIKEPPASAKPQIDPGVKRVSTAEIDHSAPLRNSRHERYAVSYCESNQREAYLQAYPRSRAWSPASIDTKASDLAAKIRGRIEWLMSQRALAMLITPDRILSRYAQLAFTDLPGIIRWKGVQQGAQGSKGRKRYDLELVDFDKLTPAQRAVIKRLRITERGTVEVEVHDQVRALDALAKHLGLFREEGISVGTMNVQINFGDGRTLEVRSRDDALALSRSRESDGGGDNG
jgi:hypothetical protein